VTPEGMIQAAAAGIANRIGDTIPPDVGFVVVLFQRGAQAPHVGTNVEHGLALRMIEKTREAVVRDASALQTPEQRPPWERPS
jgi:hypothetical protein